MWRELDEGAELFSAFWNAPIDRICIENPVMHKHAKARIQNYREFGQSIQPWQFGHGETKRTCFWLKNLPPLEPTDIVDGREAAGVPDAARPAPLARTFPLLHRRGKSHGRSMGRTGQIYAAAGHPCAQQLALF